MSKTGKFYMLLAFLASLGIMAATLSYTREKLPPNMAIYLSPIHDVHALQDTNAAQMASAIAEDLPSIVPEIDYSCTAVVFPIEANDTTDKNDTASQTMWHCTNGKSSDNYKGHEAEFNKIVSAEASVTVAVLYSSPGAGGQYINFVTSYSLGCRDGSWYQYGNLNTIGWGNIASSAYTTPIESGCNSVQLYANPNWGGANVICHNPGCPNLYNEGFDNNTESLQAKPNF